MPAVAGRDSRHLLVDLGPDPAGPCVCVCVCACMFVVGDPPSSNALSLEIGPGGDRREDRGAQLWSSFPSMSWTQVRRSPSSGPLGFCEGWDHRN